MTTQSQRVLLIGTGGIGTTIAHRLATDGRKIFATYHSNASAAEDLITQLGADTVVGSAALDVTDHEDIQRICGVGGIGEKALGGPVDTVVVTAGYRHELSLLVKQDPAEINRIITTELLGPTLIARAVLPSMNEHGFGRLVFIGSDSGKAGTLGDAASSAARAGLIGLVKSLARETSRADVTVNLVSPGPTESPLLDSMLADQDTLTGKVMQGTVNAILKGRVGQPAEIAEAVAYFVGANSGFTTGQVLSVSGGLTL